MLRSNIKELIDDKGYRHYFVAEKIGVSKQQISNWINGVSYPPMNKAFALAKFLNCKVDDLFEYEED